MKKAKSPRIFNSIRKSRSSSTPDRYYIDKNEYLKELLKFKKSGKSSDRLGELFKLHVDKMGTSFAFKNYTYLDEMKSDALIFLLKYANRFDPEFISDKVQGTTCFSYCSTIIYRAFIQTINREQRYADLKNDIIQNQNHLNGSAPKSSIFDEMTLD
jgi:hypothetical protein